ncbi:nuclear distribution protein [Pelomyxa schiedti]|nr:nuclear distribution protein [Pelomyxa schiedti]
MMRRCDACGIRSATLQRCSRCKSVFYCNSTCQLRDWDAHRFKCEVNEIADAVERTEPKLAEFMRKTNKQGIITTENLEQPVQYGKLPQPPVPVQEDIVHSAPQKSFHEMQDSAYSSCFSVVPDLGFEESSYKWTQNQYECLIACKIPESCTTLPTVKIAPSTLLVTVPNPAALGSTAQAIVQGTLLNAIKAEESTWEYDRATHIVTITLLKRWRGGNYEANKTNAETWWRSLFVNSTPHSCKWPPQHYYTSCSTSGSGN